MLDIRPFDELRTDKRVPHAALVYSHIETNNYYGQFLDYLVMPARKRIMYFGRTAYYLSMPNMLFLSYRHRDNKYKLAPAILRIISFDNDGNFYRIGIMNMSGGTLPQSVCLGDSSERDRDLKSLVDRFWLKRSGATHHIARDWQEHGYREVCDVFRFKGRELVYVSNYFGRAKRS